MSEDLVASKMIETTIDDIKDKNCIQYNNIYKNLDGKSLEWSLIIKAKSLSMINNITEEKSDEKILDIITPSLKKMANLIMKNMSILIAYKTNNKVELDISYIKIKDKLLFAYNIAIYRIDFITYNNQFDIYIIVENENKNEIL